jgi:hypothetical protein
MRGYETSMPLFDRPAQPAPAVPCNPSVPDADVARVTAQQVRILARLRQGPATGPELARIAARFSARLGELRDAGVIHGWSKTPCGGGQFLYRLTERGEP